jgi:hypothetical protein
MRLFFIDMSFARNRSQNPVSRSIRINHHYLARDEQTAQSSFPESLARIRKHG